jgi:deazaflavin-dependent oxidoreductase (nitroreductase family)
VGNDRVCYLTTTGRRTGDPHRIEIWFLEHDGAVYLFSGGGESSDWVRNLRREPMVDLELPGRGAERYSAKVLDNPTDELRRRMDARYYGTDPDHQLTEWARRSTVVQLVPRS